MRFKLLRPIHCFNICIASMLCAVLCVSCARQSATPLGLFGETRKQYVLGQDGVSPIEFDDTTTMWTFGDTILGGWKGDVSVSATFTDRADIKGMLSNSLAFTGKLTAASITSLDFRFYTRDGSVAEFIPYRKGEDPRVTRLWALDGIRMDDRVYVYYLRVEITDPKTIGAFRIRGVGLSRWDVPAGWAVGNDVSFRRLPDIFRDDSPAFGACVIRRDGYLYSVGQYGAGGLVSPIKITRVRESEVEKGSAYEFLAPGGAWTKDVRQASPLLGDVMGECSIAYNERLKRYVILYCQTWTGKLVMATFRDFDAIDRMEKRVVYEMPRLPEGSAARMQFYYSGKQVYAEDDSIFAIYINPLEYQPYLVRLMF